MSRSFLFIGLLFLSQVSFGQNISITFSGKGATTKIDSVTATNLRTNQSITLPGNETLVLSVKTGISTVPELSGTGTVFPNPFSDKTTFTTIIQKPQTVCLKVQNLIGQVVAQTSSFVEPGEIEFALSLNPAGIYMISVATDRGTAGYKVICTGSSTGESSIRYIGTGSKNNDNDNNHSIPCSLSQARFKNSREVYVLGYALSDIIRYTFTSGTYITILTNSPNSSINCEVEFAACTDNDGKNYSILRIGSQIYMAENLAWLPELNSKYYVYGYNGTSISEAKANPNYTTYGVLYTWDAAKTACPSGWHLPHMEEWFTLANYLGGMNVAGGKLKETGMSHWVSPNEGATNESGFTALPAGYYASFASEGFTGIGHSTNFWSSMNQGSSVGAWCRAINAFFSIFFTNDDFVDNGFSVRCIQN
jgi:uncharacterized protein (TIGR02145 family)